MSNFKKLMMGAAPTGPEGAWDLSYAYYDPPESLTGALSSAVSLGSSFAFSVASQETSPRQVFFKPDGFKMYIIGTATSTVYEYDLSTAWQPSSATYSQGFSVASKVGAGQTLFIKPDGTEMYVSGFSNFISQFTLSTAWDVSSATYTRQLDISGNSSFCDGLFFKPDGTEMYVVSATDAILQYSVGTAWDISTASYLQELDVSSTGNQAKNISFTDDGKRLFMVQAEVGVDEIVQYDLSVAWDISSGTEINTLSVAAIETEVQGVFLRPDGRIFYIIGYNDDRVEGYSLGGVEPPGIISSLESLFFKPDGTKLYITDRVGDDLEEYNLGTPWDLTTLSKVQEVVTLADPTGVFFKSDGTRYYVINYSSDEIRQYNMSTAWDISTGTYGGLFSVVGQETNPEGLFISPDGTKLYVVGISGDDVNEYNLSTAWSITSASYVQNFSVSAQALNPTDVFFKTDGTKMFVTSATSDDINEYNLSTAWDVSSASHSQTFNLSSQLPNPEGVFFREDGTQMFVTGSTTDAIYSYTLGPQE